MLDILIRNGSIIDGSGRPAYQADIAIEGNQIAEIGSLASVEAQTVLDASTYVVAPGFVDMHSHADLSLPLVPTADSMVQQGITTTVAGQCGMSPAPLFPETREAVISMMESNDMPLPWEKWHSFGSFVETLSAEGLSINVAALVGHGTVRAGIMGFSSLPASREQRARIRYEIQRAMDEGAIGLSTGLIYPPGSFCSTDELADAAESIANYNGIYFSHIRGEGETLLDAVQEAIDIGRRAGTAIEISHFKAVGQPNWSKSAMALDKIEAARADGTLITADLYPYLASATVLSATLPSWASEGGKESLLERLSSESVKCKMAADMQTGGFAVAVDWERLFISSAPANRSYEGRTVAALAEQAGCSPIEWVFDALVETGLDISMISFGMSEENRVSELKRPFMMIGTDGFGQPFEGPLAQGKPHPRSFGTFPRVLGHYVRELGTLSLEEAIWRLAGLPAQTLGWADRGLLRQGYKADLVVFDPSTVDDTATYENPFLPPAGIHHVIVNGTLVVQSSTHTKARPGSVLTSS